MFEEAQGGHCGGNRASERQVPGGEVRKVARPDHAGMVRTLTFTLSEMGARGGAVSRGRVSYD